MEVLAMIKRVTAKLGTMRKPQNFIVYPKSTDGDGLMIVQSDKSIGAFDPETRKGVLNIKGCYFLHLNRIMGAKPFEFPQEFVDDCLEAQPKSGDLIGSSPITGPVYIA
jgi:hypothetical protein